MFRKLVELLLPGLTLKVQEWISYLYSSPSDGIAVKQQDDNENCPAEAAMSSGKEEAFRLYCFPEEWT